MKRMFWLIAGWLLIASFVNADERILSFDSVITVNQDSSLSVQETIRVTAEGRQIKRGIYRDFPTRYPDGHGHIYEVSFDVDSVMRDGAPENFFFQDLNNGRRVMIGRKEYFLNHGVHTYQIRYRTQGQLGFFENFDELYWNVTGNGWDFPIDQASATVILPDAVKTQVSLVKAYTGGQGQTGADWTQETSEFGHVIVRSTKGLGPREGLTIAVQWPKGFITPHDRRAFTHSASPDPAVFPLQQHLPFGVIVVVILIFLGLLYYNVLIWWRYGRDPPKEVVIPQFYPPKGFSPGFVGYIDRKENPDCCLAAAILNLCVKGYLKIDEKKAFLGLSKKVILEKNLNPTSSGSLEISDEERKLFNYIFAVSDVFELSVQESDILEQAQKDLVSSWKKQYDETYVLRNYNHLYLGIGVTGVVLVAGFIFAFLTGSFEVLLLTIVMAGVNFIFLYLLKKLTKAGQHLHAQIAGFRMYLETAEKQHLNSVSAPFDRTVEVFERYLPYALALGVQVKWAEQFADIFKAMLAAGHVYSPGWYSGDSWDFHHPVRSISHMTSSLNYSVVSASTPPGSVSGGGGGGFSGGGGGGGGGGGW